MATKAKQEFTRDDWPEKGELNERGFCTVCRSFWCPHASPSLYEKRDVSRYFNGYIDKVARAAQ